jgi:hypothetical protein
MQNEYIIIYGYNELTINTIKTYFNNNKKNILLIEPFTTYIDEINNLQKQYNFKLVKKVLVPENKLIETCVYENTENQFYLTKINNYKKKHKVFGTSLDNIIKEYDIDYIHNIYINLEIDNFKNLLDKWCSFNYLIERITLPLTINQKLMNNLFFTFYQENISLNKNESLDFYYMHYFHKNLQIKRKNVILYNTVQNENDKSYKFIQKYKIKKYNLEIFENHEYIYDKILYNLENIFNNYKEIEHVDIIIQFNSDYYNKNDYFQINYEIEDALLYVNKEYDIIYSNKNCMHMLYEIIKSKYFINYIEEQKQKKAKLFKFFSKRLFYEYIGKIFKIVEI